MSVPTSRLIERWLPIAELSEEATRERRSMTALPAIYYLHVWWARRPLVASRAAVLASLLPDDTDHNTFMHALGIHGDPVRGAMLLEKARRTGVNVADPYGYKRAFNYSPTEHELADLFGTDRKSLVVMDPTAGGGSIPLESVRLGLTTISNDLNPVASLIEKASIEYPAKHGDSLLTDYRIIAKEFREKVGRALSGYIPQPNAPDELATTFLWARTASCPYCAGRVPLSPNWRLAPDGTGVRLNANIGSGVGDETRDCDFEIVQSVHDQSPGTVAGGDAACPFPDCGRSIDGDEIKKQAQAGLLGDQMFAVVYRRQVVTTTAAGKKKIKWERGFRAPTEADDNSEQIAALLGEKMPEWEALDIVPTEAIPTGGNKTDEAIRYGATLWRDLFTPRQLFAHCTGVEIYRQMVEADRAAGTLDELRSSTYVYLAFALDKLLNWNARLSSWNVQAARMRSVFDRHDFAFKWSLGEMELLADGLGFDWALEATGRAIKELLEMVGSKSPTDLLHEHSGVTGNIQVTNTSGSSMNHVADNSVDAVVMDPPYGANVMYAELSDFFYVWLKRTAGLIVPHLFTRSLADKQSEAVANKSHFKGQKGAASLADDDYRVKMEGIFAECRRVLKDDGIMTVMFTHKDTGAWDALAMSLMDAGFIITASWPVNTEAAGSLHIKDKAAANSTILLVCRPRQERVGDAVYWEDVEPEVARAVRTRVPEFQAAGIQGVDLYLASFGPALEAFSRHWPLTRGTPAPEPKRKRRTQADMFESFDPYAVRPEDALNAARREVKAWRLAQLASTKSRSDMDGPTAFYVLAWDAFKAVSFPYDEALRLARAVGVDLDEQIVGRLAEKKASELKLWDSATRIAKGSIGPGDGSRGMIDALHHAAHILRSRGADAAQEMLDKAGVAHEEEFKVALEALLEVLPPSKTYSGIESEKAIQPSADDFDALETLRRIAYADEIDEPKQLDLYRDLLAAE